MIANRNSLAAERYLDLLKQCLSRMLFRQPTYHLVIPPSTWRGIPKRALQAWLRNSRDIELVRILPFDAQARLEGRDWPDDAETMIGNKRLDNLHFCIRSVIEREVPGDLIETGVWRGGACIFMRGALDAYGSDGRRVWVADSFQGLPRPNSARYPADKNDRHWTYERLAVSLDEVKVNFERYGLLDDRVQFLVGWFSDTLHAAPIERLAVLRLYGDMYESTMVALESLYPKLSPGGYAIIDDYGAVEGCRLAVEDYRRAHRITEPILDIDGTGVYWEKDGTR